MPTTRPRPGETREMRLFSKVLELSSEAVEQTLAEFIARRRRPKQDTWRTWDELRFELTEVTGEIVTEQTMRGWAKRYGIPENTTRDGTDGLTLAQFDKAVVRSAALSVLEPR